MAKISFALLLVVAAACCAEQPRFRQQRERINSKFLARQESEGDSNDGPYPAAAQPPYPAAGYRPARVFALPNAKQTQGNNNAPSQSYGAPLQEYGPPSESTTTEPEESSGEEPTEEPDFESFDVQGNGAQRLTEVEGADAQKNFYYIQLPNGLLQKVEYAAPAESAPLLAKIQLQPIVQAQQLLQAQPLLLGNLAIPKTISYTSQYQSW